MDNCWVPGLGKSSQGRVDVVSVMLTPIAADSVNRSMDIQQRGVCAIV